MNEYFKLNKDNIFVSIAGNKKNPPILYIHGAPGIGVTDFVYFESNLLKQSYFLIAPEQRGVWRSSSVNSWSLQEIIDEYEQLRKKLHIKQWNIIAHCFGSRIAFEYYLKYPQSIKNILLENPVFDTVTPLRKIVEVQLKIIEKRYGTVESKKYIMNAKKVNSVEELEKFSNVLNRKSNVNAKQIIMNLKTIQELDKLRKQFSMANAINSRITEKLLSRDFSLYNEYDLNKIKLEIPLTVLRGSLDIVVPNTIVKKLRVITPNFHYKEYNNMKHWLHIEDPANFFKDVQFAFKERN